MKKPPKKPPLPVALAVLAAATILAGTFDALRAYLGPPDGVPSAYFAQLPAQKA